MSEFKELPETIQPTNALEVVKKFNTTLAYATPEVLQQSLPSSGFTVRSHDQVFGNNQPNFEFISDTNHVVSTETDPAVIVIDGASICALMLAKDNQGNAVGVHQGIVFQEGVFSSMKRAVNYVKRYFATINKVIGDNQGFLLLTGANPEKTFKESNQIHLKQLIEKQKDKTNLEVTELFVNLKDSLYMYPNRELPKELIARDKDFPLNLHTISGLIYVPRQIDKTGQDRIFIKERDHPNLDAIKAILFPKTV